MKRIEWGPVVGTTIKNVALVSAIIGIVVAYFVGSTRYECVAPGVGPIGDGSGRWFYMCAGPEPDASQRVSLQEAMRRFGQP